MNYSIAHLNLLFNKNDTVLTFYVKVWSEYIIPQIH